MQNEKKIFVAIDYSDIQKSIDFLSIISNNIGGIKIGLEFFCSNGPKGVEKIKKFGLPIFLDLKLKDIPNTVKNAAKNLIELSPEYLSVHLTGGITMLKEIVSIKKQTKILGVSLLTSLDDYDLKRFGLKINSRKYVEILSEIGEEAGIDGIVSSAHEVPFLKKKIKKKNFIFVTPGIRLLDNNVNDQKRIVTPGQALNLGSSLLVIGRTITKSSNPIKTIDKILKDIEVNLGS